VARRSGRSRSATPRPADALAALALLQGRPDYIAATTAASAHPTATPRPPTGYAAGREPIRGRAIVELLERKGIQLAHRDGRLLPPVSPERISPAVAELITACEPLLVGFATGHPLACELEHKGEPPEAVTKLMPDWWACEAHRSGELAP
jgi:hypothetical protein